MQYSTKQTVTELKSEPKPRKPLSMYEKFERFWLYGQITVAISLLLISAWIMRSYPSSNDKSSTSTTKSTDSRTPAQKLKDQQEAEEFAEEMAEIAVANFQKIGLVLACTNKDIQYMFGDDVYILYDENESWSEKLEKMDMYQNGSFDRMDTEFEITDADQSVIGKVTFMMADIDDENEKQPVMSLIVTVPSMYLWEKEIVVFDGVVDDKERELINPRDNPEQFEMIKSRDWVNNDDWYVDRM